jgi:hypothetical protein
VPSNLLVDFPSAFVPFSDLFNAAGIVKDFPSPAGQRYQVMVSLEFHVITAVDNLFKIRL